MWPVTPRGRRDALPRQLREEGEEAGKEEYMESSIKRGGVHTFFSSSTPSSTQGGEEG